jgi:thiamine pyrophosphokinase
VTSHGDGAFGWLVRDMRYGQHENWRVNMRAAVVSNGDLGDIEKLKSMLPKLDLVVCSDGGARHLKALSLQPDILVGDFDSANPSLIEEYMEKGVEVLKFSSDKDETDTQLAVEAAVAKGADSIVLLGAIGSRWDHSYGNVMLLVKLAKLGIEGVILHSHNRIYVSNKALFLSAHPGQTVSLLPLGENVKIEAAKGLHYSVENQYMPLDYPFGISNIFTETTAEIRISSGWLMAVIADD